MKTGVAIIDQENGNVSIAFGFSWELLEKDSVVTLYFSEGENEKAREMLPPMFKKLNINSINIRENVLNVSIKKTSDLEEIIRKIAKRIHKYFDKSFLEDEIEINKYKLSELKGLVNPSNEINH